MPNFQVFIAKKIEQMYIIINYNIKIQEVIYENQKNVCIVPCLLLLAFLLLVPMQVNASSKVKLSKKNVTLIISQKQKIKVKNVKNTKVKWKSSNTKIASVKKGVIVAKRRVNVS